MKTLEQLITEYKSLPYGVSLEKFIYDYFAIHYAAKQISAERERIKKELLDIINLYNDNEMFGYSVAKNAINNL